MQTLHEGRTTVKDEFSVAGVGRREYLDDKEDFSDEPLVVVGLKGGLARRMSTGGIARIEEKSRRFCALM